eukprot:TRINITY_DN3845_c0_g2_i2.p1 TRINITY_DN3845_c0_g2~~TRINITY_DN3845_c0_g2_i2.p1  ORF type:complete len:534 (+),score=112.95 TRINITY_DN3845_c0_g2_i2:45-1604(+)
MRCSCLLLSLAVLGWAQADEDIILPPVQSNASLPERLLVLIPGGLVPNEHYKLTGEAIQKATTDLRLTVVIPQVFQRLCIITCTNKKLCSPLKSRIDEAVAKSGFKSQDPTQDTFLAGHSLGATCANYLAQGYSYEFAGLLEFGGFVDLTGDASVANFSIPVLHMAGELDGGGARVSSLAGLYGQAKSYAESNGWEQALKMKPVHVLEGLDHSDFCPGFFVTKTKDCKSEVSQDAALEAIGAAASAFLHLHSPTSDATKAAAMATMQKLLKFTQEMCEPFLVAFELEGKQLASPPSGVPAGPWCEVGQQVIAGLPSADADKLKVEPCTLITAGLHQFEHQHTNYTVSGGSVEVTCFSAVEPSKQSISGSQFSAVSVDCKMVDATRIGEQLHVTTNSSVQCADINRKAVEVALKLLPAKSLKRYQEKGRGVCFEPDTAVFSNIGPLWVKSSLTLKESEQCLSVASSGLNSPITSKIFPGNHYCKLWSPAAAMDWMMTDSHKPFPYPSAQEETMQPETIQI